MNEKTTVIPTKIIDHMTEALQKKLTSLSSCSARFRLTMGRLRSHFPGAKIQRSYWSLRRWRAYRIGRYTRTLRLTRRAR